MTYEVVDLGGFPVTATTPVVAGPPGPPGADGVVALGETAQTAYRGDRGKAAFDHIANPTAAHAATAISYAGALGDDVQEALDSVSTGFVTATITGDPSDPDVILYLNGVEL